MLDGILFEKHGIPAAVIITEPFESTVAAIAELHQMPDYAFVKVPHPVTSLSSEEIRVLAAWVAPVVAERLLDSGASGEETLGTDGGEASRLLADLVEELAAGLRSDGADLTAALTAVQEATFTLHISDRACAECILPGDLLLQIYTRKVAERLGPGYAVHLVDPRQHH